MRAIAPNADLRPFHSRARSALVGRDSHRAGAVLASDRPDRLDLGRDARLEAVDLDEQHRGGVAGVAGADEVLDRPGDLGVHHLERGRDDARRDDAADRRAGRLDGR